MTKELQFHFNHRQNILVYDQGSELLIQVGILHTRKWCWEKISGVKMLYLRLRPQTVTPVLGGKLDFVILSNESMAIWSWLWQSVPYCREYRRERATPQSARNRMRLQLRLWQMSPDLFSQIRCGMSLGREGLEGWGAFYIGHVTIIFINLSLCTLEVGEQSSRFAWMALLLLDGHFYSITWGQNPLLLFVCTATLRNSGIYPLQSPI